MQCRYSSCPGLAISGDVVVCAEPFVITVVSAMSIEQFARILTCRVSQEYDIRVSWRSEMKETSTATVKPRASVRRDVMRAPYREASIIMTARACLQRQASSGVETAVIEAGGVRLEEREITS
jgi:hypothetical protein